MRSRASLVWVVVCHARLRPLPLRSCLCALRPPPPGVANPAVCSWGPASPLQVPFPFPLPAPRAPRWRFPGPAPGLPRCRL
eukprot:3945075-Prymnesium_polylepis.1